MQRRQPDFAAIIAGLQTAGLSRSEIARQTRTSQPYISRLAIGDRRVPSWPVGDALLGLAQKHNPAGLIKKI